MRAIDELLLLLCAALPFLLKPLPLREADLEGGRRIGGGLARIPGAERMESSSSSAE